MVDIVATINKKGSITKDEVLNFYTMRSLGTIQGEEVKSASTSLAMQMLDLMYDNSKKEMDSSKASSSMGSNKQSAKNDRSEELKKLNERMMESHRALREEREKSRGDSSSRLNFTNQTRLSYLENQGLQSSFKTNRQE